MLTQTENISFPSFSPQSNSPYLSFEWSFYGDLPNNRSCRGLKIVQNALECTMKWFYIVSQTFFMNSTMENPPWIKVHLRLLLRNKLCSWHEDKLPETFSVGQLSREIWKRCIEQRTIFKILLLVYKARSGEGPKYLKDLLLPYSAHHKGLTVQLRSSDDPTLLDTPSTDKITYGDRSFSYAGTYYWNKLPQVIRELDTLPRFKKELKTHLFEKSY